MIISVPIYPLHYDEDYYPDPEKFDPDRYIYYFMSNKINI